MDKTEPFTTGTFTKVEILAVGRAGQHRIRNRRPTSRLNNSNAKSRKEKLHPSAQTRPVLEYSRYSKGRDLEEGKIKYLRLLIKERVTDNDEEFNERINQRL